jgi:energy-coupling factor transporter ATP-binding protein EcfA2
MIMEDVKRNFFENGNTWIRADFHLHTKADKEFKYDGEDNSFTTNYIAKLKSENIKLGVITNHNKFVLDEFKALKKKAKKTDIGLLPGVELSVNDGANGIHVLVVFSDEWISAGQDYINNFLNVTFSGRTPSQYEQENARSNDDLSATLEKLESYNKSFFIVFAHVEAPNGLWSEVAGGKMEEMARSPLVKKYCRGFQKVRTINNPEKVNRLKVTSWWKESYPAEVEGSDPKQINEIGRGKSCFINIGDFSFDAVRYALSDHIFRVASEKTDIRHSYIKSVRYDGGLLDGVKIPLSSGLNCLIGIRGSGKSSILESLRYGLDIPMGDTPQDQKYKESLLPHFLKSGGKITIEAVDKYGDIYDVSRILNSSPDVYQNGKHVPDIKILGTIIINPLYFGQKDLASAGDGFGHNLVDKIVRDELIDVRKCIAQKQIDVKSCIESLSIIEEDAEQLDKDREELTTVKFKLEKLDKHGIKEKLTRQVDYDNDTQYFGEIEKVITEKKDSLFDARDSLLIALNEIEKKESITNQKKIDDLLTKVEELEKIINKASPNFESIESKLLEISNDKDLLDKEKDGLKEDFAKIERGLVKELEEQGVHSVKPNEYLDLSNKKTELETSIGDLEKRTGTLKDKRDFLLTALSELNSAWHEEFIIIKKALERINVAQDSLVIESIFKGDKSNFSTKLEEHLRGHNIRKDTYGAIADKYFDFGEVYKDIDGAKLEAKSKSEEFKSQFLVSVKDLLTCQIPNKYDVTYRGKALRSHSLGQRASAMMLFILSQNDNDLLLIDQPEDDLDNQTIYEDVVKLVRKMKPNQQFIFATHNANFPVLGDSDQLVSCELSENKIDLHIGSIDNKASQQKIVKVMEGGAEAFNRRKSIYHIWKADV